MKSCGARRILRHPKLAQPGTAAVLLSSLTMDTLARPASGRPRASSMCTAVRPPLSISTLSTRAIAQQPRPVQSPFTAFFRHMRFHSRDCSASSSSESSLPSSGPPSPLLLAAEPQDSIWRVAREVRNNERRSRAGRRPVAQLTSFLARRQQHRYSLSLSCSP